MSTTDFWLAVANGKHYQFMTNMLQLNNVNGTFSEIGHLSGIAKTEWSWGCLFADLNNNGLKDIIITNGYFYDIRDRDVTNYILKNNDKFKWKKGSKIEYFLNHAPRTKEHNYIFENNGNLKFSKKAFSGALLVKKTQTVWLMLI